MHDTLTPSPRNASSMTTTTAALVDFYDAGSTDAANELLGALVSDLERDLGESQGDDSEAPSQSPIGEGGGASDGHGAAPPFSVGCDGVKTPPSSLIHEDKDRSTCETTTYEPIRDRVERYENHHRRALEMAKFCQGISPHRAEKLRTCGTFFQFRNYYTLEQLRLTSACFCQQDRLCGLCACRRGGRLLRAYVERTQAVLRADPGLRPFFVTLTVKDGPDLSERVTHVLASARTLTRERAEYVCECRRGRPSRLPAMACASAGVGSCEVKRGKNSGLWHPHWHAVWLCHVAPDLRQLRDDWERITGDSFIVDARPFHLASFLEHGAEADWESIAGDFCEVFKYTLKLGDLDLSDNWQAFLQLQRRRMVESFGLYRGIAIPADLTDSPLAADLPFIEILMRFRHSLGKYKGAGEFHHTHDETKCSLWPRALPAGVPAPENTEGVFFGGKDFLVDSENENG